MVGLDPDCLRLRLRLMLRIKRRFPRTQTVLGATLVARLAARDCPLADDVGSRALRARRFTPLTSFPRLICQGR